ncbi:MAG: cytochrome P460 family protein [Planctomycetota bacterium]|nr:cytochrome P460 family protein [Planctomycetota bacterium]
MQRLGIVVLIVALGLGSYVLSAAQAGEGDDGKAPKGAPSDKPADKPAAPKEANDKRFHAALKAAAQVYLGYGRVDDEARWAPFLCRTPRLPRVRMSASADPKTHGRKLYYLFAKQRDAYAGYKPKTTQPVGQVIVKEAWTPEPIKASKPVAEAVKRPMHPFGEPDARMVADEFISDGEQPTRPGEKPAPKGTKVKTETAVVTVAEKDGTRYRPKARSGIFVMLKLDPKTEGTDGGWVYGTLTPDGQTVTSAGRVASCMGCHAKSDETRDRMFGLPRPAPPKPKAPAPKTDRK